MHRYLKVFIALSFCQLVSLPGNAQRLKADEPNPVTAFQLVPEAGARRACDVDFVAFRIERGDDVEHVSRHPSGYRLRRDKKASAPRH